MGETPEDKPGAYDSLHGLFEMLKDQNYLLPHSVSRIELTICSYTPLQWQCNVRLRDRGLVWGTHVSSHPEEALLKALGMTLRGDREGGSAFYFPTKAQARELMSYFEEEYSDLVRFAKLELEPYEGWVVVLFVDDISDPEVKVLRKRAEVRQLQEVKAQPPRKVPAFSVSEGSRVDPSTGKSVFSPLKGEGRMGLPKDALEAEYKKLHGKFPDRNIKKADLAKMLDEEEAKRRKQ